MSFLIVGGVGFLVIGIYIRIGGFKTLFLAKGIPVLMPRAIQNIFIFLGLILILLVLTGTLVPTIQMRQNILLWVIGPLFISSLVIAVRNPRWLRPRWLAYLEDEYGSVMWKLLEEASKDARGWSQRVRTQKGLERWAEETRIKLGYPPHPGQIERQANMK